MSFTFDNTIPAANNNPSSDQPLMLQNNVSIQAILGVDHITFNQSNGGQHLQVTLPATTYVVPGAQVGNASVIYPNAGKLSTAAQLMYVNSNCTTQLSAIRAWALCDSAGNFLDNQFINVASVNHFATGRFGITLTAGCVNSINAGVFVSAFLLRGFNVVISGYQLTGVGTFDLNFIDYTTGAYRDPDSFAFSVFQI